MTTSSHRPPRLDVKRARAHAHAPGRPSPLRKSFDADGLADAPPPCVQKITRKIKVPIVTPALVSTRDLPSDPHAPYTLDASLPDHIVSATTHTPSPPPSLGLSEQSYHNNTHPQTPTLSSPEVIEVSDNADTDSEENMRRSNDNDAPNWVRWTPSVSPTDTRATRATSTLSPTVPDPSHSQVFTYTPYISDDGGAIAAAAQKNRDFLASLKRQPTSSWAAGHDHLRARLRRFESRRTELQKTITELEHQRRAHLAAESDARAYVQLEISQQGWVSQGAEADLALKISLREWTDDDLEYDQYALAKVDRDIRRWERFVGELARGEPCSRTRLRLKNKDKIKDKGAKRSREDERHSAKVTRAKMSQVANGEGGISHAGHVGLKEGDAPEGCD